MPSREKNTTFLVPVLSAPVPPQHLSEIISARQTAPGSAEIQLAHL